MNSVKNQSVPTKARHSARFSGGVSSTPTCSSERAPRRSTENINKLDQVKRLSRISLKRSRSPNEDDIPTHKKRKKEVEADKSGDNSIREETATIQSSAGTSKLSTHQNSTKSSKISANIENKSIEDSATGNCSNVKVKKKELNETGVQSSQSKKKNIAETSKNVIHPEGNQNINHNDGTTETCDICKQAVDSELVYYVGHPQNAVEEDEALSNEILFISSGKLGRTRRKQHTNITGFSIFDQRGHLCPPDSGLVKNNARICMSGYLKPNGSDSPEMDELVPVKNIGPIIKWNVHGFDGGDRSCITLSTKLAEYTLQSPSEEYKPLMDTLYEKIWLKNVIVEYLKKHQHLEPTYEELLENIRCHSIPELNDKEITEELLHKHAGFLCDQVNSLEPDDDNDPLITLPCMNELIQLMGIKVRKRRRRRKVAVNKVDKKTMSKATTTPLVRKTFENIFTFELDKTNQPMARKIRCGVCEACQLQDCGKCKACRAMVKFGGHGHSKKSCKRRLCQKIVVKQSKVKLGQHHKSHKKKLSQFTDAVSKQKKTKPNKIKVTTTKLLKTKLKTIRVTVTKLKKIKPKGTKRIKTILKKKKAKDTKPKKLKQKDTKLNKTKLKNTKLKETKSKNTKLGKTKPTHTKLTKTKSNKTKSKDTILNKTKLKKTKPKHTLLNKTKLRKTKPKKAKLEKTKPNLGKTKPKDKHLKKKKPKEIKPKDTKLKKNKLKKTKPKDKHLKKKKPKEIKPKDTKLKKNKLKKTKTKDKHLKQKKPKKTKPKDTKLRKIKMKKTKPKKTKLKKTKPKDPKSKKTKLNKTKSKETILKKTKPKATKVNKTKQENQTKIKPKDTIVKKTIAKKEKRKKSRLEKATVKNARQKETKQQNSNQKETEFLKNKQLLDSKKSIVRVFQKTGYMKIKWIGEPVQVDATKTYYEQVEINDSKLYNGDFILLKNRRWSALVVKVVYMWKESSNYKEGYFHGEIFMRSSDTILGGVGDPREVFMCDRCCHGAPLSAIIGRLSVEKREIPADWVNLGGKPVEENPVDNDDGKTYFYSKYYEKFTARFEDLPENPTCPNEYRAHRFCTSCERKSLKDDKYIPRCEGEVTDSSLTLPINRTEWSVVKWNGYEYKKGCAVFLKPYTFRFTNNPINNKRGPKGKLIKKTPVRRWKLIRKIIKRKMKPKRKLPKVDEDVYPEYYRKNINNRTGSNEDTLLPFCVGYIEAITAKGEGLLINPFDIYLKVKVMYRPENTINKFHQCEDLNLVYWSDEIREIRFAAVTGPCQLVYVKNIPAQDSFHDWLEKDPNRFYFRKAYSGTTNRVLKVPSHATTIGMINNNMQTFNKPNKGKGKGKSSKPVEASSSSEPTVRPLRTLDVFAGCGGLSEGLHRAGAAECLWAVENLTPAARAYALNNKDCAVFTDDCNELLRKIMDGATHSGGMRLPMRGEVELLCGGPPCQGFSGMNRFNLRDYSNFKNSLIASFLSYCDYYRPKYFILENVRSFVVFKRGMVLKLTMRALLDMGYQCTFGVLQAGHYGIPQTRRRLIVLAAAPGCVLPLYPEPTHVFSCQASYLLVTVDKKRFKNNSEWRSSAPRRTCTVRDAMSDLPEISNGASCLEMEYGSMPKSHYQRAARRTAAVLRDHICKKMSPLAQARIDRIPTTPGSDWRDLPNLSVELSDGTKSKVLEYRHDDKRSGRSRTGALRGVCACAAGKRCSPHDKQDYTLIPWCMPHTANRHNHWAGIYGRVGWEGYLSTTVTDPEPMGKQGRVLHPAQPRVLSVRECARSQGFPDHYAFAGSLPDKHRQIGNAVPPPLGEAIGREIKKAMLASPSLYI